MMRGSLLVSVGIAAIVALPCQAQTSPVSAQNPPVATSDNQDQQAPGDSPANTAGVADATGAASAAGVANSAGNDDIVVTATRESTLLSKTPIALTAITGSGLIQAGITDARALGNNVPNLFITQFGQISIRGVTSNDTTEKGDPSSAFLIDGIYIARPGDVLGGFFDLQRVEVLRGPQGTLYGRNTTAGVVNVISAQPVYKFAASLEGEYGNIGDRRVTGMVNIPLGESIAIRGAVNYERRDSFIREGVPSSVKLDPFRDALSARLSLGGESGAFKFVVRGYYGDQNGTTAQVVRLQNFFPGALVKTQDPPYVSRPGNVQRSLDYAQRIQGSRDNHNWAVQGEFSYDLDFAELTYLGSYRESKRDEVVSQLLLGIPATETPQYVKGDYKQQSHELRASFGRGNPLHGQAGAYYFRETAQASSLFGSPGAGIALGNANVTTYGFITDPAKARSIAGFGQVTYDLTSNLHVTGGIRYTQDDKSRFGGIIFDLRTPATGNVNRITISPQIASRTFKKTTWRAGIDYDASGLGLLYASVSTGYKAGGFNDGCVTGQGTGCTLTADALYYDPETLTAYEAGFKFRFLDDMLRVNASAFHYDYSGLQLSQVANNQTITRNAAKAKVDGVELEAVIVPGPRDRVDLSFNYLDARYARFAPDPSNFSSFTFNGRQLDRAPKVAASAGYTHTFPIGAGGIEASARTRLSAEYYLQDLNNLSQFRQPSFTKSDVTLTYRPGPDGWYLQGFAKNLENTITLSQAASGTLAGAIVEEPRTYGVRAGIRF